ncbi:hypothetical protein EGC76_00880 [Pseudidiomarina gelatinasegens]|uniref:Uncharacterized protein n=1 Tax=Pseudidiomarina gelatinasegens TaxID=2487740 RepID=A0A443Z7A0_9GAMM|nr:hypothetical protein [Pseudidiomarina gelatinasegens]RWU12807.1 hypothetical protein EGC76_00880 [Pseudidiomarina gelatinasegens]
MTAWCFEGWRHQSHDRDQILTWLTEAKQLGFQRYSLWKCGAQYWLCCSETADHDGAIELRQCIDDNAVVVVQVWQQRLVCVAWRDDVLLGACGFSADHTGVLNLLFVAQDWLAPEKMGCSLFISGNQAKELLACHVTAYTHVRYVNIELPDMPNKQARFRSLRQHPAWLRRRVLVLSTITALTISLGFTWWFWPEPEAQPLAKPEQALSVLKQPQVGWDANQIAHLSQLLSQVSYLAGWQVLRWELTARGEQLIVQPSYGRVSELLSQLTGSNWDYQKDKGEHRLVRPLKDLTQMDGSTESPASAVGDQLEQLGFSVTSRGKALSIKHDLFDPHDGDGWQQFLTWLSVNHPNARLIAANAVLSDLIWQLQISIEDNSQGTLP